MFHALCVSPHVNYFGGQMEEEEDVCRECGMCESFGGGTEG